jgi:hypothetical protein
LSPVSRTARRSTRNRDRFVLYAPARFGVRVHRIVGLRVRNGYDLRLERRDVVVGWRLERVVRISTASARSRARLLLRKEAA